MGCCFSRNFDDSHRNPSPPQPESNISNPVKPPISPQLEEETVKEVLSETPSQKPKYFPKIEEQKTSPILPSFPKIEVEEEKKIEKEAPFYVTQEVSEICSLSESYSTTTLTERKEEDEEGEVRQRNERSPAKIPKRRSNPSYELGLGTDHRERRSPVRRSEPSPSRRNDNAVKFGSNTDVGQNGRRRISAVNNNRSWRDPGESSGRRSRSPSTRTEMGTNKSVFGTSPSARKTGRLPARIPSMSPERSLTFEGTKEMEGNGLPNESLENPLVSLECFIFL